MHQDKLRYAFGNNQQPSKLIDVTSKECIFDITSDGAPRGAAYIEVLEARIASLEAELQVARRSPSSEMRMSTYNAAIGEQHAQGTNLFAFSNSSIRMCRI